MTAARELELWRETTGRWFPARVESGCTIIVGACRMTFYGDELPKGAGTYLAALAKGKTPKRRRPTFPMGMSFPSAAGRARWDWQSGQRAAYDVAMVTGRWAG